MFLLVAYVLQAQALVVRDVPIRYVRPSHIAAYVLPRESKAGLVPLGVALEADDADGIIHLRGKADDVKAAENMICSFDIRRCKGRFAVMVESPDKKDECEATVTLQQFQGWAMTDELTRTTVDLRPRFTESSEASLEIEIKWRAMSLTMVLQMKPGATFATNVKESGRPFRNAGDAPVVRVKYLEAVESSRKATP